jgi:hypothetical protein
LSEAVGRRRLSRDHLDESILLDPTSNPGANGAALRKLVDAWEGGFADRGIVERLDEARETHSLLDAPDRWEIIYARPPQSRRPDGEWTRLGIDVAYWTGDFFSALDDLPSETLGELNPHGLVDDTFRAEEIRQVYLEVEPGDDVRLVELWAADQP